MKMVGDEIQALDQEVAAIDQEIESILIWIPNIPHESAPKDVFMSCNRK